MNRSSLYPASTPILVRVPTCIVMTGLPARGKTFISRKLARYLNWIGVNTKVFSLGQYRRKLVGPHCGHSFFDHNNPEGMQLRKKCSELALQDITDWFSNNGQVAIFDATNTTRERRERVLKYLKEHGFQEFFIESFCEDVEIVRSNIMEVKVTSPDYKGVSPEEACKDYFARIDHYRESYEPLSLELDRDLQFMKIIDGGKRFLLNHIQGYLQSRIVYYIMNLQITPRSIFLSRHGESQCNLHGMIGGDSNLSDRGHEYSKALAQFMEKHDVPNLKIWTSELQRTYETAGNIGAPIEKWKALNEIDAGDCEGMTYEEIQDKFPEDFARRDEDKFHYRYPRGESYEDVVARLEPVIMELERQQDVLVICHQAVARCLLAYFLDEKSENLPYLKIPLHSVLKLTPVAYGCRVERFDLNVPAVNTHREKPTNVSTNRQPEEALQTVPPHQ